jgi:hypothetical protein
MRMKPLAHLVLDGAVAPDGGHILRHGGRVRRICLDKSTVLSLVDRIGRSTLQLGRRESAIEHGRTFINGMNSSFGACSPQVASRSTAMKKWVQRWRH